MVDTSQDSLATAAEELPQLLGERIPTEAIDSAVAHLDAAASGTGANRYPARGSIASAVILTKCQCTVTNDKTFKGDVWGLATPGGGALIGDVYTDNIDALYANTTAFTLIATPVYTTFIFQDRNGATLGSFQAGSISTVIHPPRRRCGILALIG